MSHPQELKTAESLFLARRFEESLDVCIQLLDAISTPADPSKESIFAALPNEAVKKKVKIQIDETEKPSSPTQKTTLLDQVHAKNTKIHIPLPFRSHTCDSALPDTCKCSPIISLLIQVLFELHRSDEVLPYLGHFYESLRAIPLHSVYVVMNLLIHFHHLEQLKSFYCAVAGLSPYLGNHKEQNNSLHKFVDKGKQAIGASGEVHVNALGSRLSHESLSKAERARISNTYLKLVELFTTHCLLPLGQFQEARYFIQHDDIVPQETKQKFLHAIAAAETEHLKKRKISSAADAAKEDDILNDRKDNKNQSRIRRSVRSCVSESRVVPGAAPSFRSSMMRRILGESGSSRRTLFWWAFMGAAAVVFLYSWIVGRKRRGAGRLQMVLFRLSPIAMVAALYQLFFRKP